VSSSIAPVFSGPDTPSRALIDACVHCGFCLPTCPTYLLWGEEMDSPRGRIYLMKGALEGRSAWSPALAGHFDACLGCVACVTACPSGVQYGPLIERARAQVEQHYPRPAADRWFRTALFGALPHADVMRLLMAPLAIAGPAVRWLSRSAVATLLPARVRTLLELAPTVTWRGITGSLPERTPAVGPPRLKVGVLVGCVQRVAFPQVNEATVNVLSAEGCEVRVPADQECCGALSRHAGRLDEARAFARKIIEVFERAEVDRVVVNAAGCGSSMKEYGELFADDPVWAARAHAFSAIVRDASELVAELGPPVAPRSPIRARVAYHDACHLAHAQGIRTQPRDVLRSIPGIELVEVAEPEICCGSAGIYNLVQPEAGAALGERKARNVLATEPDVIATGNPGCTLQLRAACARLGTPVNVLHPMELLDASIKAASQETRQLSGAQSTSQ
jgi:glycolate oxidase iron-sulfur subunit